MYRSHNCGELRINDLNKVVKLSGWVQKVRDKGFIMWVDLRDRYGVTQLIFDQERTPSNITDLAKTLGREFVINVTGSVIERNSKNDLMNTGDIEILVSELKILNTSITIVFGFSILVLSNFIPTIYFGVFTGIAMLLAMISVLTLLPSLILTIKPFGQPN